MTTVDMTSEAREITEGCKVVWQFGDDLLYCEDEPKLLAVEYHGGQDSLEDIDKSNTMELGRAVVCSDHVYELLNPDLNRCQWCNAHWYADRHHGVIRRIHSLRCEYALNFGAAQELNVG